MNQVRALWHEKKTALAGWLQLGGSLHAEALARLDYDAIVVDMQHSLIDFSAVVPMLAAIELGGATPLVRLQSNDPSEAMKLLDAGAYGLIAPMVNTAADAKLFAAALHYPPHGVRSYGPRRPNLRFGSTYFAQADQTFVAMAMIETRSALECIDEILAVEGLDGVFIGPTDLAVDLGSAPSVDSEESVVVDAIAYIRQRAHAAGRRVGIFCGSGAFAQRKIDEGFDLVTAAPDLSMLLAATRAVIEEARAERPQIAYRRT